MHYNIQIIDEYLNVCQYQKRLNSKTIKAYRIDLYQFNDYLLKQSKSDLNRNNILSYVSYLNQHYKPKSVKRKIASIKAFCRYLELEDMLLTNPFSKIHISIKEPFLLPKTIPLHVIEQMLIAVHQSVLTASTPSQEKYALRDAAIIELLFATGMRVSELCQLNVSDVNLIEGYIKIYGKGSKDRKSTRLNSSHTS